MGERTAAPVPLWVSGSAAGLVASVVQVAVGKGAEKVLPLADGEDADLAPRLVRRLAEQAGIPLSRRAKWALGTAFHLGYAVAWGVAYGAGRERTNVRALPGGVALGSLIYGITFPRWGLAVKTKTEQPPERRSRGMSQLAWSVALTYGLATALLYERWRD